MNLSVDEMLRLARIVTGRDDWRIQSGSIRRHDIPGFVTLVDKFWFPSLTGEDWQKAQALDCIVAAHEECKFNTAAKAEFERALGDGCVNDRHDLLEASARALLAGGVE